MTFKKKAAAAALTPVLAASIFVSSVSAAQFPDVKTSHRAYEAVEAMVEAGVISGFPDGTFKQYQSVTRAESAILIGRALGIKVSTSTKTFTDLPSTSRAYPYVAELMKRGIFSDSSRFYPGRPLSRSEMAIILTRAFDLPASSAMPFTDVSPTHGAASYIRALAAAGITTGVGDGKYDPAGVVTRGQMAIFLNNARKFEAPVPGTPVPGTQTAAEIKAEYADDFTALQAQAEADLDVLAGQAKAELDAGADLMTVYNKYFPLASKVEAETDADFNALYTQLTAALTKAGFSASEAQSFKTAYEAAKKQMKEDLMNEIL
ncbi:S-layer homology domain-containing protein [Domibacillus sp. DTU_2020_1001157_1_SI_ALB_TIR_016]|uniref:S-layer homology domain-containing protein n=1 Tax=Domibacillus sp. DTU_2020_1001157_1_SI_ALB_TIR_016 TaxID=3077789 RepID=UPI0028E5B714|nr:S-layer homology domain-containing protein [Domibacillus sp. DTU_2020_1001157_1_SI_ALB_TIR_016]WNS81169.1 S-layer homology domain-containing protein [Domibacillus sp. DTU_2020_1001157_1_SI_ALB_TIR_016]